MTETEAKWAERVLAWRSSGKTAEQFADGRGFEPTTLRYWASRLARSREPAAQSRAAARVRMVRVDRKGSERSTAPAIVIAIGAARIEVHEGFDRALLGEVIEALEGAR